MSNSKRPQAKTAAPAAVETPYRPRIKKSMVWHPGHCTRSFVVTDFYSDLNAMIMEHGEVVKCCGQYWRANRRASLDVSEGCDEPHPVYTRYRSSIINDVEVAVVARPLSRCQCTSTPSNSAQKATTGFNALTSAITSKLSSLDITNSNDSLHTTSPITPVFNRTPPSPPPTKLTKRKTKTTVPQYFGNGTSIPTVPLPITPCPTQRTAYLTPSASSSAHRNNNNNNNSHQTSSTPSSTNRDNHHHHGLSGRLPLERVAERMNEGFGNALGKLRKSKESKDENRGSGSSSSSLWGCVGEAGMVDVKKTKKGKKSDGNKRKDCGEWEGLGGQVSPRSEACYHNFYCTHCGQQNSVWSDRRD
ncbi:hypothetical protein TWF730_005631 [Orbilia blumenaviensis]|uniref:Uncharacterized protein n=1 Tax=Orbilia blumenaviensis TaxID=1796055 RepID=A0AAV9VJ61_9PEZI